MLLTRVPRPEGVDLLAGVILTFLGCAFGTYFFFFGVAFFGVGFFGVAFGFIFVSSQKNIVFQKKNLTETKEKKPQNRVLV